MNFKILPRLAMLFALMLMTFNTSLAQQVKSEPASLKGTVLNAIDGSTFKDVRIWIMGEFSDTSLEIHADKTGHYEVQLPEGYYFILIGTGGYIPVCKSIWVLPGQTIVFSVRLSPDHENMID
jgi:hypothetical protein